MGQMGNVILLLDVPDSFKHLIKYLMWIQLLERQDRSHQQSCLRRRQGSCPLPSHC